MPDTNLSHMRAALWTVLMLSVATAAVSGVSLHRWLADPGAATAATLPPPSTEPAAVVPGGSAIDHSVVLTRDAEPSETLPELSVAAYER